MRRRGFTLIELITVMGISAILLTIITIPMVQSFNLTRASQGFADAQDRARVLIDAITREIANSTSVRDNSGDGGAQVLVLPGRTANTLELRRVENVRLDIMSPSGGEPVYDNPNNPQALRDPNRLIDPRGDPNDPNNWVIDPTLKTPRGQVTLPTAGGFRMVRYFIGLRAPVRLDPSGNYKPNYYNNPYDGLLMSRSGTQDNLYVLYRADVEIRQLSKTTGTWVGNGELFNVVNNEPVIDDPEFFTVNPNTDIDGSGNVRAAKVNRILAWQKRARVVTEVSRYDMIQPVYDKSSRQVVYDGNVPRIIPLVQFSPSQISNEPAGGLEPVRTGLEGVNAQKFAPDVYRTSFGGWTSVLVRLWPSIFNATNSGLVFLPWDQTSPYLVGRNWVDAGGNPQMGVFRYLNNNTGEDRLTGIELFDVKEYLAAISADPQAGAVAGKPLFKFPFSHAISMANLRPGGTGNGWVNDSIMRRDFIPFVADVRSGKLIASFAITEVGTGNPLPPGLGDNRPYANTGDAKLPSNDPESNPANSSATRWQDPKFNPSSPTSTINQRFNVLWNDWNLLTDKYDKVVNCKRFLDLRLVPTADGAASPLHPTLGFSRSRIVPGSEVVIGPDALPGTNFGKPTRYSRLIDGGAPVGPNQYRINYVDQPQKDWAADGLAGVSNDPQVYLPNDFISAVLQPPKKVGYLEFDSDPSHPLPNGNILVSYRFQFTEPSDVFSIDYDSRQVMEINLTIRNYPQTTLPNPLGITVKGSATVRNYFR